MTIAFRLCHPVKSTRLGSGQCGTVEMSDGTILYISYSTIVGLKWPGQRAFFTDERFSVTTSKHISTKLGKAADNYQYDRITAEGFAAALAQHGHDARHGRAPHSF
jgi:hypothetical protein